MLRAARLDWSLSSAVSRESICSASAAPARPGAPRRRSVPAGRRRVGGPGQEEGGVGRRDQLDCRCNVHQQIGALGEPGQPLEQAEDLHGRQLLLLGPPRRTGPLTSSPCSTSRVSASSVLDEDAVRAASESAHRVLAAESADEVRVGQRRDATEAPRVDRGQVRRVLVDLALHQRVRQAEDDRGRGLNAGDGRALAKRGGSTRAGRTRRDPDVRSDDESRVGGLRPVVRRAEGGEARAERHDQPDHDHRADRRPRTAGGGCGSGGRRSGRPKRRRRWAAAGTSSQAQRPRVPTGCEPSQTADRDDHQDEPERHRARSTPSRRRLRRRRPSRASTDERWRAAPGSARSSQNRRHSGRREAQLGPFLADLPADRARGRRRTAPRRSASESDRRR